MAAPSKGFTIIADSAIDADSPLTEDLMEDFRDNDIHLEEWLGLSYTAAQNHDHDGVNSALVQLTPANFSFFEENVAVADADTNASWAVSTSAIGFAPIFLQLTWSCQSAAGNDPAWIGNGWAWGTAITEQCSNCNFYQTIVTISPSGGRAIYGMDYSGSYVCGIGSGSAFGAWGAYSDYAQITNFDTDGITITTQSGTWANVTAGNIEFHFVVWGA